MTEYTIVVQEVVEHTVVVTAPNQEEAHGIAHEALDYIGEEVTIDGLVSLLTEGRHYEVLSISPEDEEEDE
jgi:hypothetical protein